MSPPMTSKVVKVLVKEGEMVEIDQVLIIIEALKMEIPISSPIAGRIKEVLVKEGQDVDKGASLLVITSP